MMTTKFVRNYGYGLGSNIGLICIGLDNIKFEGSAYLEINMRRNYNCEWSDLFDQETTNGQKTEYLNRLLQKNRNFNRSNYSNEDLGRWNVIYNKYIHPKPWILEKIDLLTLKYKISEVTCVYFRGTDKHSEAPRIPYDRYLSFVPREGNLWIQSDEMAFIKFMKEKYPERAFSIDEFSFKDGNRPFHEGGTMNDAIEALTIMYLMSKSKQIIANISNMTQVGLILRGNNRSYTCVQ